MVFSLKFIKKMGTLFGFLLAATTVACAGGGAGGGGGPPSPVGGANFAAGPSHDSVVVAPDGDPTHLNCASGDLGFVGIEITKADPAQIPVMGKPFPVLVSGNIGNKCGKSNGVSLEGRILRVSSCSAPPFGVYKEISIHYTANQDNHFEVVIDTVSNSFDPTDTLLWRFALAPVGYQATGGDTAQSFQIKDECYDPPPEGWTDLVF